VGLDAQERPSATATSFETSLPDYRALVEQVEDYAMFILDLDGRVATWNRGAQRITQYRPEEIIGRHFSALFPAEDLASGKAERELEVCRAHGHLEDESWRIRRDGSRFWAFVSITLLRDERGEPRGFAEVTYDLSERRRADEQLRLSEERFRMLVDGVADYAIYMLDPAGIITTWNSGAEKIKGYRAVDVIGRHFSIFFSQEDQLAWRPQAELEVAASVGRFEEEGWRVRSDGTRLWANVTVTTLRDSAGELMGFSKVTRDLTAHKRAEATARELERQNTARMIAEAAETRVRQERERFRSLSRELDLILEGVVDGITVQDRSGRLLFANTAAARAIGLGSREELMNLGMGEMLKHFEMLDEHGNLFPPHNLPGRRVLAGEQQATALLHIRDKRSGKEWWSSIRSNGVKGADGLTDMAINIWHDVSLERRREEQERYLASSSATLSGSLDYRVTLETLADLLVPGLGDWCAIHLLENEQLRAVTVAHADPRKKKQAEAYQSRFPPNPEETSGVWQVLRTGQPILHADLPDEALRHNAVSDEQYALLKAVGMRSLIFVPIKVREQVSGTLSLIAAESGRRYDEQDLALVSELGRRVGGFIENARLYESARAAAANAEAAAAEAEAAGRLKDEFLATVSHELRTPLNAIMGWSALLKTRHDAPSIEKGIDVIHRNAKAQSKIIEDILDVSRIITGKLRIEPAATNLLAIVNDAIEVVRPSASAQGITIELDVPGEPLMLVADAQRLQQVMWNLLSNAVKFNVPSGRILVRVEQSASQVVITVQDNGKGIELAFLPYVFDRFKQADGSTTRRYGGLGLGLAIVRHIVELHGGTVAVSSLGPGSGSTFTVSLPLRASLPPVPRSERPSLIPSSGKVGKRVSLSGVRVLVVDDERDARELLDVVLRQAGAEVCSAASVSEALGMLSQFPADIVVSDIGMPEQDGYALMQRLRASPAHSAIPAIALTAYTRVDDKTRALSLGFTAHVGKPVNPDELMATIAQLTAGASGG
jgi:PAS domain S-box-containing protein